VDEAPQQASSLLVFGKRCQTDGEHEVAIRVFERIVDEFPDARAVPSALTEIAASQRELRRWDDALVTYGRLVEDYPETDFALAARFETGVILREGKGQPAEAEQIFRTLIGRREGPWSDAEPQMQVAECSLWQGDLERARGIYAAVRARPFPEPTLERALFEEARALFYSGTLTEADSLFKMVAQQYPRGAHVNDALQFSILINTNPDEPEVLGRYAEAELALRTSRPDDAVQLLAGLVADHPDAAIVDESLYLTGRAQRARGDSQRALAVLERAAAEAQVPDLAARARLLRAEIFAEDLGDRAQALKEYEELLVAWPETLAADRARDRAAELTRMLP
jgi:TolA-binding protein